MVNVLMCEECGMRRATATGICEVCDGELTEKEYDLKFRGKWKWKELH